MVAGFGWVWKVSSDSVFTANGMEPEAARLRLYRCVPSTVEVAYGEFVKKS